MAPAMGTRVARSALAIAGAGILAVGLAACSGSSSGGATSASPTPDGGGEAVCDQATFEGLTKEIEGENFTSFTSFECQDGYALVTATATTNNVEVTQVYLFQAEGQFWALQQRDAVCADGADVSGIPSQYVDTLCALR